MRNEIRSAPAQPGGDPHQHVEVRP
jgi:hypothetical protein